MEDLRIDYNDAFQHVWGLVPLNGGIDVWVNRTFTVEEHMEFEAMYNRMHLQHMHTMGDYFCREVEKRALEVLGCQDTPEEYSGYLDDFFWEEVTPEEVARHALQRGEINLGEYMDMRKQLPLSGFKMPWKFIAGCDPIDDNPEVYIRKIDKDEKDK